MERYMDMQGHAGHQAVKTGSSFLIAISTRGLLNI